MLFLLKNHPFYEQFNKETSNNNLRNTKTKNLEFQLKKRYEKSQAFNPNDCYTDIENSRNESTANSELNTKIPGNIRRKSSEIFRRKSLDSANLINLNTIATKNIRVREKISFYKALIKVFDVLSVLLIIGGAIISQYEQELYYQSNLIYRIPGVVMKEYISANPTNHSLSLIFDEANVDLNSLTNFNIQNYQAEYDRWKVDNPQIVTSSENMFILSRINVSLFGYSDALKDEADIKIPLYTNDFNNSLRITLVITTCLSCVLIISSWYVEHIREYLYKKELDQKFYKGEYFLIALIEIFLIMLIQYPGINSYLIFVQMGTTFCLPISSILSSLSIFRFIFIYKIFKNFSVWNSVQAEIKCEKYVCHADTRFAFKALQKENPFFILFVIFVLTCVCFGLSLRIFEIHFWETRSVISQNWNYQWNAMWCVFVSMTTVGYGDFYPKTHFGRFIIILACMVGIYFVSMTMVFMTGRSVLNESELKAYKLIARLKLRREMKDLQAKIVYHGLIYTKKKLKEKEGNSQVDILYQRRCIFSLMREAKKKEIEIKNFNLETTKEQLIEMSNKIDTDIKEIKKHTEVLSYVNNSLLEYSKSQTDMLKHMRKNEYAMRFTIAEIASKPSNFGELANYDKESLGEIFWVKDNCKDTEKSLGVGKNDYLLEKDPDSNYYSGCITQENFSPEKKSKKSLENDCPSLEDDHPGNSAEVLLKKNFRQDEGILNHPNSITPEKDNTVVNQQKNLKEFAEDLIKFKKNPLSNGVNLNLTEDEQELKKKINLKRKVYSDNKVDKNEHNSEFAKISTINFSSGFNEDFSSSLAVLDVNPEEIKSHFNFLFLSQTEISKKNSKMNSDFESPLAKDTLKDDELKIKTMVKSRRFSSRKSKIFQK